jgi:dihydroorotate dehydrogenase electron transfer subunit
MIEQDLEIVSNREVATGTFLMVLRSPEMASAAKPGQFVMIRVRPGVDPLLRRPFSVCGLQGDDLFLVLYRVVGRGTAIMAETKVGARLSVLGPLGMGFQGPNSDQLPLLVGGGIGIAPLIFLAQAIKSRPMQVMTGFSSASEIVAVEQVIGLPVSVTIATDDGTAGFEGPITEPFDAYLRKEKGGKDSISVFTCGPEPMLKKVAGLALDQGIPCQASLEAAMACGLGVCQGCAVKASPEEKRSYHHVCTHGPVFQAQAIDWNNYPAGAFE